MAVDTTHPEYDKMREEWLLVRAAAAGQREVKALGRTVLPCPAEKPPEKNDERYKPYKLRALYVNIAGRTKNGLTGAAFRKDPQIKLPAGLDYLEENADGGGQSLIQLCKDVFGDLLTSGREVLLVEYPEMEEGLTEEQVKLLSPQATIKRYTALDFINWKTSVINGKTVLTQARLKEVYDDAEDEFESNPEDQIRVLRLGKNGYTQQIYRKGEAYGPEIIIKQHNGAPWPFIPLFVIGSQNNDVSVDEIPLADIAHVNMAHYRNSADLEENCHMHGQLTLGIASELDWPEFKAANPDGVKVGAMAGHYLGRGGSFSSVQTDENQLADKLMERKEEQAVALGAKLIENKNPTETATQAKIDATGENSVLGDLVSNVEEAFQRCIEWCGLFMGETGSFEFEMNREFFDGSVDPATVIAGIQLYDRGIVAKLDIQNLARKANMVEEDRTSEQIDAEAEDVSPLDGANSVEQQ